VTEHEAFKIEHKGFIATACLNDDPMVQDANIVVTRDGVLFGEFKYPAYRIWNIYAHWQDEVETLLAKEELERDSQLRSEGRPA
jgi:hypothetical protein